ncbi:TetR/AcrR family transcriptional regulator [Leekyejoonella antrihumi]|uniref:TetR/AcrR family transcriptional regulator n=1 Tax=Leekyejoonella antrihumi TaxID=1660198 RepID=A0A563E679_9MICO|nr:TetR/AcrR family transcriptional regulator [Leekyejoonella antrihumi]TWP37344.1 TetR/AcrR family transcriptional regulator [Leekyejoonella antrihumi]
MRHARQYLAAGTSAAVPDVGVVLVTERTEKGELDSARARLLEAARDAFADKGFFGTTTRDISAAAGMSPAAVYVHHRSKEAMLYEISLTGHRDILQRIRAVPTKDPALALREMVRQFVLSHAEGHTTARVVNYELGALSAEHRAEIDGLRHEIQASFRDLIAAGARAGVFGCDDIGMTANAIMGMGIDVARWYHDPSAGSGRRGGSWSPGQVAEHHARMALHMVSAH